MPFSVLFYCKISFVAWWAMGNQQRLKQIIRSTEFQTSKRKRICYNILSAVINSLLVGQNELLSFETFCQFVIQ